MPIFSGAMPYCFIIRSSPAIDMLIRFKWLMKQKAISAAGSDQRILRSLNTLVTRHPQSIHRKWHFSGSSSNSFVRYFESTLMLTTSMQIVSRVWFLAALLFVSMSPVDAQVPHLITYQGRVNSGGSAFTGTGQFKFALIDPSKGGV